MNIKEFLETYGELKKISKGDYLYQSNTNDTNFYYIISGEFLLSLKGKYIAIVSQNELSGEKSFLENMPKPIDAKALVDSEVLYITKEKFDSLEDNIKNIFLKEIVLKLSTRVQYLNTIISAISNINKGLNELDASLTKSYIEKIFSFISIENIYVYKLYNGSILPIFETDLANKIDENILNLLEEDILIKCDEEKIIIKNGDCIVIIYGQSSYSKYVIRNIFMHSLGAIKYLCNILENKKNTELNEYLDLS